MFVIYGQQDSGKTHAMWLILAYLLENGAELQEDIFHAERPFTTREIFATKEQITDFKALIKWQGASILLLSAGDYLENKDWGFRKHMKEAEEANIDYFVCCARENTPVYKEIKERYEGNVLNPGDWEYLNKQPKDANWMVQSDEAAWNILCKLHRAIMPNVEANYSRHSLQHQRILFPVGHGGFAFERIGNCNVLFDCGSHTSPTRLQMYIDALRSELNVQQIDYLFISHFDQDHANGIRMLLDAGLRVRNAVMSYIAKDWHIVYNIITGGAYLDIQNILRGNEAEIIEVGQTEEDKNNGRSFTHHKIWEWVAKSMLKDSDFKKLKSVLGKNGLDENRLSDPAYLAPRTGIINKAYKEAFGAAGPNAKGLIMLSQRTDQTAFTHGEIENDCSFCYHYCWNYAIKRYLSAITYKTCCLYDGDAMIKSQEQVGEIESFLEAHLHEGALLLMQLPHHGSQNNINPDLHRQIIADFYFVCYQSDEKIKKVTDLYDDLTKSKQLLMIRDICSDIVINNSSILP